MKIRRNRKKKGSQLFNIYTLDYFQMIFFRKVSPLKVSPISREEGVKKAKIGITIKKSPNSDRTFESRLLDQDSEPSPSVKKNKPLERV